MTNNDDFMFEEMFSPPSIKDDGFSKIVISKIRKQLLIRRITLTLAIMTGALIAATPVIDFLFSLENFPSLTSFKWSEITADSFLKMPLIFIPAIFILLFTLFPITDD